MATADPSRTRHPRLDAIDVRILAALQNEGRLTRAVLAERVGLSPTPAWERLKRLEKAGYVRGYHADIALERLAPITTVLVEVTLKQHHYADFERFEHHVRKVDGIVECVATGGGIDYLLKVVAPSVDAYQRLMDALLVAEIGIDRYFTYVVTRTVKAASQPPVALVLGSRDDGPQAEPPAGEG